VRFADRMNRLGTENAFEVLAEVNKLKAQGRDIISFALGEPDFDTPESIKEACIKAIQANHTHYSASAGIQPLREAIATYIADTRAIPVHPDEVVVTPGGKPIIYYVIHALLNPGDEALYPNPGYPIYESIINFVGGKPVPMPLLEARGFSLDTDKLKDLITPKTRLIVLNSPQNPTGGMLTPDDLAVIAKLAVDNDLWVLSDEVYSRIIYSGQFHSIGSLPGMKERTVILDGFSKTYAMTGWRLGYGVMPAELATLVARLVTNCESCTNTFIQHAAVEALKGPQDASAAMVKEFKARRDLIVAGLNDIKGFSCKLPNGSFYVFPNVTQACRNLGFADSKQLQQYILHQGNTAVLPRTSFGVKNIGETEEYIRLSYATSQTNIIAGLKRIKDVIER
jgi:aspartate aminotransferase